jgi:hypothetical protein
LLHQTAIESLVLIAGGLFGFAPAYWSAPAGNRMLPAQYPLCAAAKLP